MSAVEKETERQRENYMSSRSSLLVTPTEAAVAFESFFEAYLPPGASAVSLDYLRLRPPQPPAEATPPAETASYEPLGQIGTPADHLLWQLPTPPVPRPPSHQRNLGATLQLAEGDAATAAALRAAEENARELLAEASETAEAGAAERVSGAPSDEVHRRRQPNEARLRRPVSPPPPPSVAPRSEYVFKQDVTYNGYCRLFHASRRYGFIRCDEEGSPDLYFTSDDIADVTGVGSRSLRVLCPGERVTFEVAPCTPRASERSMRAIHIQGPEGGPVYVQNHETRRLGTVRFFSDERQYGFLTPLGEAMGDVFFHTSNVVWAPGLEAAERQVEVGMTLEYALLEPDGSVSIGASKKYEETKEKSKTSSTTGGRRVGVCLTAPKLKPLDPVEVERAGETEKDAQARRERRTQAHERRRQEAEAGKLISGVADDDVLATTW